MIRLMIALLGSLQPQTAPARMEAVPFATLCNAQGSLDHRFGDTSAPPALMASMAPRETLPAEFAPFTEMTLSSTKYSNKLVSAEFTAEFASAEAAEAARAQVAAGYRALGWVEQPIEGNYSTNLFLGEAESPKLAQVELLTMGNALTMKCSNVALEAEFASEAMGRLPPGTPRPVAPVVPRPEALDVARCATPAGRAEILAKGRGAGTDPLSAYIGTRMQYRERLVEWKTDRLRRSGKVSADRLATIALEALDQPMIAENMGKSMEVLTGMIEDLGKVAELEKAGDQQGACAAVIRMVGRLPEIEKVVDPQWDAIEAMLDAEAARIGVSFD